MNELRLEFTRRDLVSNWRVTYRGNGASLCNDGVRHYVELPVGCKKFHAVFSKGMPWSDHFELIKSKSYHSAKLDLADDVAWLGRALSLMNNLYIDGYRYMRVEY